MSADPDPLLNTGQAVPLYVRLITFADVTSRNTGQGYPYRARLASSLSCSKQTVDRATNILEQEIGLVTVDRRKVDGKPDENDANRYVLHDGWLIENELPPANTPPQLVARYGHTVRGFDREEWLAEHAPDFDLTAWQAAHDARIAAQEAKEAEQRRKERARRKPKSVARTKDCAGQGELPMDGGGVTGDATPEGAASEGGGVMHDATGDVICAASGGVTGDALLSVTVVSGTDYENPMGSAVGQSAGGLACAGAPARADGEIETAPGGSAANPEDIGKGRRQRGRKAAVPVSELMPVAGEEDVYTLLDSLSVLDAPAARIPILRRAVRAYLGHNPDPRQTAFDLYPRTPSHATTRISWKWYRTDGPNRAHPEYDGPDKILRPAGYLATLLIEQECDLPQCEMGVHLDSGEECRLCRYRQVTRIGLAESKRLASEAQAELQQQLARAAVQREAAIEAAYDEAAAANKEFDRIRTARTAATEDTARLREQLTAEHPELAADATRAAGVPGPRDAADHVAVTRRGRQAMEETTARTALLREGLRGTALDDAVRNHMVAWKAKRRQEAQDADLVARALPVGTWPTGGQPQDVGAPF
ncbi:hypothetical protein OG818_40555 [Streptomyces virginiae]|nr:hypothetical protein [Streptomyces virginiae]